MEKSIFQTTHVFDVFALNRVIFLIITEAVTGGVGPGTSRPTSPVPGADITIEIDEDPPEADAEPLVCACVFGDIIWCPASMP